MAIILSQKIRLDFDLLDLEESETENCRWDFLDVYDGKTFVDCYCGSVLPATFVSSTEEVKLLFRRDINHEASGFRIRYETGAFQ